MSKNIFLSYEKLGNIAGIYSMLFGLPFILLLSYSIFKPTLLVDLFQEIADFGNRRTSIFWGIIYPLIYLSILFISGKNIILKEDQFSFKLISRLSFSSSVKNIFVLIFLFVFSKILNGVSTSVIPVRSLLLYSFVVLLFIIFISTIINFIVSSFTIKALQNKFNLQKKSN